MRVFVAILFLAMSTSAAAVIVTFDDVPAGIYFPSGGPGSTALTTPQGYEFGMTYFPSPVWVEPRDTGGQFLEIVNTGTPVAVSKSAGVLFSLSQLDIYFYAICGGCEPSFVQSRDATITAKDATGSVIAETTILFSEGGEGWRTVSFDSSWTGIASLELGNTITYSEVAYGGYDNIVVTTAPISAEVQVQPEAPFSALHPHHDGSFGPQGITALPDDPIAVVVITQSTAVGDPVDLNATDIDPTTLAFGPGGGAINPASTPDFSQDVDSDGLNDARFEFLTSESGIQCADAEASLSGELLTSGDNFLGTDAITTDCAAQCHN